MAKRPSSTSPSCDPSASYRQTPRTYGSIDSLSARAKFTHRFVSPSWHHVRFPQISFIRWCDPPHRCWDRNSLSLIWQITPRSCQMFVPVFLLYHTSSSFLSGRSCLSVDRRAIAITNLFDGVDWYDLTSRGLADSLRTTITDNVITPIISDGAGSLIIGGSCGTVQILQPFPAIVVQSLGLEGE